MTEQERMLRYTLRTKIKNSDRYTLRINEAQALFALGEADMAHAICLAYDYGMARGYHARKNEVVA